MKTNELRLGNLVMYNNQIVKATGLHYDMFECGCPDDNNWMCTGRISEVRPIELTEELLLKIRFKKGDTSPKYQRYYLEVCGNGEGLFLCYDFYYDGQRRLKIIFRNREGVENELKKYDIKYIHELQNIFWDLTKQELKIKL